MVPGFDLFSPAVGLMSIISIVRGSSIAALLMAALASACSVSETGLGPMPDAGSGGTAICPAGLTDHANWPAGTANPSCTKPCGPDDTGLRSCSQTDKASCQAAGGCVCLETPCVSCANCAFRTGVPADCYAPTNAASAPACAKEVTQGGACSSACSRQLCLGGDGKTGCVCNAQGKFACATWGDSSWK
ncbi:MAG TPA: hypothetical protein VF550_22575 [Polyangia bacterium]